MTIPLSSLRTADEALEEDNLLGGEGEWEDEEEGPTPMGDTSNKLPFELEAFVEEASRHVGALTGLAYFAKGIYHQVRSLSMSHQLARYQQRTGLCRSYRKVTLRGSLRHQHRHRSSEATARERGGDDVAGEGCRRARTSRHRI